MEYPEGATPLDLNEMDGIKHKHVTTRGELDHLEQANIQSGLRWLKRSRRRDLLTEIYVRHLHRKLFGDVWKWAGTFRTTEKNIGVEPREIAVQLRLLLDDVQFWIAKQTYSPQEIALRFHHRLVLIHPFPNGNGRLARVMADALLSKVFDQPPLDWTGKENVESMGPRRRTYISALQEADRGNYDSLLAFAGLTPVEVEGKSQEHQSN